MSRLVTGLFYDRAEAEQAAEMLRASGIPADSIYLEAEVEPSDEMGWKGGEVGAAERERRIAGLETGLIIGFCTGLLAGYCVGILGSGMSEFTTFAAGADSFMPRVLTNPWLTTALGALMGVAVGGIIGWMIDYTLDRMGAGPALPTQETLVTVRTDDGMLGQVEKGLFQARARHLHVSEAAF